jgi:hypothetical protein
MLLISKLESSIYELAIPFSNEVNIISSMPGIKNFSAICIISEIGTDMSVFHSSKHLCSHALFLVSFFRLLFAPYFFLLKSNKIKMLLNSNIKILLKMKLIPQF